MVRGLRRLLALAPNLAPLLLFFRPATNREHPPANRDCPATNPNRHATNRNIVFRTRKQISTKWRTNFWTIYLGRITILNYWVIKAEPSQFWTFNATKWTNIFRPSPQGGLDLWQVGKIIKVALSAALEPTAARVHKPRLILCLRRTFPKKNKWPDTLIPFNTL